MSIIDSDKVDGMGIHNEGRTLAMLISDHLDWTNEYEHLMQLQNKLNAYIAFIESKQYEAIYPEQNIISYQIEVHFQYEPVKSCIKLLDYFNKQLEEMAIVVDFMVA